LNHGLDYKEAKENIEKDLENMLFDNMQKLDPTFALENYEHASKLNESIKKIYELLGPLNFDL
jgi:hypothetical protein